MADRTQHARADLADWQTSAAVWNAVRYLDSASDYREYLPKPGGPVCLPQSEFVILDDGQFSWAKLCVVALIAGVICTTLLLWLRS